VEVAGAVVRLGHEGYGIDEGPIQPVQTSTLKLKPCASHVIDQPTVVLHQILLLSTYLRVSAAATHRMMFLLQKIAEVVPDLPAHARPGTPGLSLVISPVPRCTESWTAEHV
jgi:hypothetical protein